MNVLSFGVLYLIFLFGFIGLTVYLMISVILFFKRKNQNDKELLNRMDELIKLHAKHADKEI